MTVKEFYQWAVEHGAEDFEMGNVNWDGYETYIATDGLYTDWKIDETEKIVYTEWEG